MRRRDFLKTGVQATAITAAAAVPASAAPSVPHVPPTTVPSPVMTYTEDDHRQRLRNIALSTRSIRTCLRKHLITNYLPGQCCYNLGEYPSRTPWSPDESDERELDQLKAHGIELIQVMDEWNDRYGLFGGNKLTAVNPAGFRRFVQMVHQRGMKILAYASSGYFNGSDPDFRPEWSRPGDRLKGWWDLVRCSPASPGWRAYLLPRMMRILDDYGVDGLYNDWGYVPNAQKRIADLAADEIVAFDETPTYDGAVADLLQLIYAEVKRRGGIYKVHADRANQPQTDGVRVYDYLWVGENVRNADALREAVKNHPPYVVPCIDGRMVKVGTEDEPYLHSIPYLQFPLLLAGRVFTGERAVIPLPRLPGIQPDSTYAAAWKYYQAHPHGPYLYGGWDSIPPNPETRPTHARWLKRYLPLVEEGTWAFLEIGDSDLFIRPLADKCIASAFINRHWHLVLANFGHASQTIETAASYVPADTPRAVVGKHWELPPRSLRILRRVT
jgi:hypothetical protein